MNDAATQQSNNSHYETDRKLCPYLLAASFQGLLSYTGHIFHKGILHFIFFPKNKAETLIDQFRTRTDPRIPAQDLFIANETFWQKIANYNRLMSQKGQNPTGSQATQNKTD